eukprot:6530916-Alexandrium_andersonii.AAC.1
MSASLVGSEMCIRDSCRPSQCPEVSALFRLCPSACAAGPACPASTCTACLLYTSDAADDM